MRITLRPSFRTVTGLLEMRLDDLAWDTCLAQFRSDLEAMQELVADASIDLLAAIPHGDGQTILREAMLVAHHNAYYLGQLVVIRQALEAWRGD